MTRVRLVVFKTFDLGDVGAEWSWEIRRARTWSLRPSDQTYKSPAGARRAARRVAAELGVSLDKEVRS